MPSKLLKSARNPIVVFSFGVALVLFSQGYKARDILIKKSIAQNQVTKTVTEWKKNYLSLSGSIEKWNESYVHASKINDLFSLIKALNIERHGLEIEIDKITLSKAEVVTHAGVNLGLMKACLINVGQGSSFSVKAENYTRLLNGIETLTKRPDISVDSMTLGSDQKKHPAANLQNFCIYLRG